MLVYTVIIVLLIASVTHAEMPASQSVPNPQDKNMGENMVLVKGGCFDMGDTFGDGDVDEKPVHRVCVDDFYIGKYEVTQKEWFNIMGNSPSSFRNCDDCTVENISYLHTK